MRTRTTLFVLPSLAIVTGCVHPVNTIPPLVSPTAEIQRYDVEVPPELEIKAVDFSSTAFSEVSGGTNGTAVGSTVGGRAFVKVYAVHRSTGEQFLLLYEDIVRRRRPIQIIRFVSGADSARD